MKKRSLRARLQRNMFVIVVCVLLVGWGLTAAITWPGFHPRRVNVVGTVRVTPDAVRGAARIAATDNIWLINPWGVAARVDALPYVRTVAIERAVPNRITLAIEERLPDGCLTSATETVTIDATDRVLERGCVQAMRYRVPSLKRLRVGATVDDVALARLRADIAILAAARVPVTSAEFDRDDGLVAVTRDNVTLLLGEDATLVQTSALLRPIFDAVRKQGRRISQVDLRAPSTPVVRYKDSSGKTEKSHG